MKLEAVTETSIYLWPCAYQKVTFPSGNVVCVWTYDVFIVPCKISQSDLWSDICMHAELAHMVELYVNTLNSPGGIPVIGSTWQRVLEATYAEGMDSAISIYTDIMEEAAQLLPMESEDLLNKHSKGIEEATKNSTRLHHLTVRVSSIRSTSINSW